MQAATALAIRAISDVLPYFLALLATRILSQSHVMSYHTYEAAPGGLERHPSCLLGRQPRCEAAFPGIHADRIFPRLHVPFFFLATLTVVARFASKYMRNAKWALDDWLIMTGLVTSPSNHSQAAADALSCSSTVKELALFRVGPIILYSIYR